MSNTKIKPISKQEYPGDWPFIADSVTLELRNGNCCIVHVNGKEYALTGLSKTMYNLKNVHDAGVAISGKSTSDFIRMAFELNKTQ